MKISELIAEYQAKVDELYDKFRENQKEYLRIRYGMFPDLERLEQLFAEAKRISRNCSFYEVFIHDLTHKLDEEN